MDFRRTRIEEPTVLEEMVWNEPVKKKWVILIGYVGGAVTKCNFDFADENDALACYNEIIEAIDKGEGINLIRQRMFINTKHVTYVEMKEAE